LYLNWNLVLNEHQYWRLITCFLYFGSFGLHFFWDIYVLVLTILSLIVDYNSSDNFFGILVGHIYFFFTSVFPLMPIAKNTQIFKTPYLLKWMLRQEEGNRVA
ncbi:hypothetical protein, partial [Plasmodium yoelii yoelii]